MIKLKMLMATAMMFLMLGCASPGFAQIDTNMENPKFLGRSEPVLGLDAKELVEVLGQPREIVSGDCHVPLQLKSGQPPIPVSGDTWVYTFEGPAVRVGVFVCVVKGYAVAERRTMGALEGKRIYNSTSETLDLGLIEKAFKGELDDSSHEERTGPQYDGPEYEI